MKTRCINLKDFEARGILDGSITALWRPVKLTGHDGIQSDHSQWRFVSTPDSWTGQKDLEKGIYAWQHRTDIKLIQERCPYGQPGDVLICREAFRTWSEAHWHHINYDDEDQDTEISNSTYVAYRATPRRGHRIRPDDVDVTFLDDSTPLESNPKLLGPWLSAQVMPAALSRIRRELVAMECRQVRTLANEEVDQARAFNESANDWLWKLELREVAK